MPTNCVKLVNKSVHKSAQKTWNENVNKLKALKTFALLSEFYRVFRSFAHSILTWVFSDFNLLSGKFCTFYTDTTNTTINIKEGF